MDLRENNMLTSISNTIVFIEGIRPILVIMGSADIIRLVKRVDVLDSMRIIFDVSFFSICGTAYFVFCDFWINYCTHQKGTLIHDSCTRENCTNAKSGANWNTRQ